MFKSIGRALGSIVKPVAKVAGTVAGVAKYIPGVGAVAAGIQDVTRIISSSSNKTEQQILEQAGQVQYVVDSARVADGLPVEPTPWHNSQTRILGVSASPAAIAIACGLGGFILIRLATK